MELLPWFPAITTTGILAFALWLCRQLISTRLTKSVEHEFNTKLESIRAEVRASEERLKAELREKEAEISALRSGALSALSSRQAAFDKRRLEAVDELWSSFNDLAPARSIAATMSVVNFKEVSERAVHDPKVRETFEMVGGGFDIKSMNTNGANKGRPFVTPMVWAIFSAIYAVTYHGAMRWFVIKNGIGKEYTDKEHIEKLIVTALPEYSNYVKEHGPAVYTHVLSALETKLLAEIQNMLMGAESNKAAIQQAAEILRQANEVQAATRLKDYKISVPDIK